MARIEYVIGVKCKKCGAFFTSVELEDRTLCQNCGAKILYRSRRRGIITLDKDGEEALIKVTHKFFGILTEYELIAN